MFKRQRVGAEAPLQTVEAVPQAHVIDPGDSYVFNQGFGEPYDHVVMVGGTRTKDVGIVAQIETPQRTFIISPDPKGEAEYVEVRHVVRREDNTAINLANPKRLHIHQGIPLGNNFDAEDRVTLSGGADTDTGFIMHNSGTDRVSVTVAPPEKPILEPSYEKQMARKSRIRRSIATIALAAASILPVTTEIHDKIVSGKPNYSYNETVKLTEEYSIERAEELGRTMQDIDNGNFDAVRKRAEAFRKNNTKELPSREFVAKVDKAINNADTNQEVVQALDGFMGFYNKDADFFTKEDAKEMNKFAGGIEYEPFASDTNVQNTREMASAVVNSYKMLPKSLMESMDFQTISLGDESSDYKGFNNGESIVLGVNNWRILEQAGKTQGITGTGSNEWVALHELGHSHQADSLYFDDIQFEDTHEDAGPLDIALGMVKEVVDIYTEDADLPSTYAYAKGGHEADAEIFAGALTPNSNDFKGLSTPRDATAFHSKSNRYMLHKFVQMQQTSEYEINTSKDAAFSDWIFAHKYDLLEK